MAHPEHADEFVLTCKHIGDSKVDLLWLQGGEDAMVVCEECSQIDFNKIDWDQVRKVGERADALGITAPKARREYYLNNAPPDFDRLQLACKTCTLEIIASKLEVAENQTVESLAPCSHCGRPILVKHELAASIKRLVANNQGYFFSIGVDEKEIVIKIRKRGSSRVSEPGPVET